MIHIVWVAHVNNLSILMNWWVLKYVNYAFCAV